MLRNTKARRWARWASALIVLLAAGLQLRGLGSAYKTFVRQARSDPARWQARPRELDCPADCRGWEALRVRLARLPDQKPLLFINEAAGRVGGEAERAHFLLSYALFPRRVLSALSTADLTAGARRVGARYVLLYRVALAQPLPAVTCRFAGDLILIDLQNEMSCDDGLR